MMDKEELDALKAFCRITGDQEDGTLEAVYAASAAYLAGAGVTEENSDPDARRLCLFGMSLYQFEQRGEERTGSDVAWPLWLRLQINQLKETAAIHDFAAGEEW